jgi:chromosomal replication initiator protein
MHIEEPLRAGAVHGAALWDTCLDALARELPEQQFNTWIKPLAAHVAPDQSRITLFVANRFKLDWVRAQYAGRIATILEQIQKFPVQVELALAPRQMAIRPASEEVARAPVAAAPAAEAPAPVPRDEPVADHPAPASQRSRLNAALTFEALVEGSANRMARAAALHVAGAPGQLYNPLFIYGGVGLGKTHLMHAVGNQLLGHRPERQGSLHPCRAICLGCGQGVPAQDLRRVQAALPLA